MITVLPCSAASETSSRAMASALTLSRLPVGSSARMSAGSFARARPTADALLLAAAQFFGTLVRLVRETDELEDATGAVAAFGFGAARHDHRQLEVLDGRDARNEIVELKHEADFAKAIHLEGAFVHAADVGAIDLHASARRPIDAAEQIEQCRLAAAARPHDGDGLAVLHLPVDALQRLDVFSRGLVNLADLRDGDIHAARREKRSSPRSRLPDPLARGAPIHPPTETHCDADEQHDEHDTDDGGRPRRPETRRQQLYDRADLTQFPDVIRETKSAKQRGHTATIKPSAAGEQQCAQEKPPHVAGSTPRMRSKASVRLSSV